MQSALRWEVLSKKEIKEQETNFERLIDILLENRGIKTKEEKGTFLNSKLEDVNAKSAGIDQQQLGETLKRILKAIKDKEQIIVYGDYDVDGITGTAILWETLHSVKANALPYIPNRIEEGYGISKKGIENLLLKIPDLKLIITVDNGIVANEAITYAKSKEIDVIVTDHHTKNEVMPSAYSFVHTTKLCGASVAWILAKEIKKSLNLPVDTTEHLDLVALATVADLVPLTDKNRILLKNALPFLQNTKRIGLHSLFSEAGIDGQAIGVYEIGHIIGPRLNAMGRLESAMDSLRLICTKNPERARKLAHELWLTNRERQILTTSRSEHAIELVANSNLVKKIIIIAHESYEEGIIGLIAGKLVEKYYRPVIVISKGKKISKASARSIAGFNIIEFIRKIEDQLINAGGHPMAAGFTVDTEKITVITELMEDLSESHVKDELLTKVLKIDCKIPLNIVSQAFFEEIQKLAPFGMGNTKPVFLSNNVRIEKVMTIGKDKKHLKFNLSADNSNKYFEAIAFNFASRFNNLKLGQNIDLVYIIEENNWNGRKSLQLKIKDLQLNNDNKVINR